MKIVITGGCGFTGHHFVEHFLKNTDWEIIIFDRLSYASFGLNRLRDIKAFDEGRVKVFSLDLAQYPYSKGIMKEVDTEEIGFILHLAAETHVDNSINNARSFVWSNVMGTWGILEFARTCWNLKRFVYFSTDEVFGPAPEGKDYKEWDRYNCTNPYSATKAGGEELSLAYANCYGVPVLITHTMNMFGERQHPEKFIPLCIRKITGGETIHIHSNSDRTKSGSRFYIHARNVADATQFLLAHKGANNRDKFNIVGEKEVSNLDLANLIATFLDMPLNYELVDFHSSRPGHDLRYALDGTKMKELGWVPPVHFEQSLEKVVRWTLKNWRWVDV